MDKNTNLYRLMAIDFALYETVLFLDTHPDNSKAKQYYDKLTEQRKQLVAALEAEGNVLRAEDVKGENWTWINTPWPWQNEEV